MSTAKTCKKPHPPGKNSADEICEMPEDGNATGPDLPGFANLTKWKDFTEEDLSAATAELDRKNRSSFSKIRRVFKQRWHSKGKTPLLGHGTQNRGRFLSLDSSDIFQTRAGNLNRRSSWYGGNIRNTSFRKSMTHQSNCNRKCSKVSVQTLDSDGLPVHCGVRFDVRVDVHRTASGSPVDPQSAGVREVKSKDRDHRVIIRVDSSEIKSAPGPFKPFKNVPEIIDGKTEVVEFDGRFCRCWLRIIERMTRLCPDCSEILGPVLITVSLCIGFVFGVTAIVFITWIIGKMSTWWA